MLGQIAGRIVTTTILNGFQNLGQISLAIRIERRNGTVALRLCRFFFHRQDAAIVIKFGHTDLPRGIDGLAALVKQEMELDPFSNSLFLFCGRRRDRIKALYWEGNGFVLLYKRLESGSFQWPRKESEAKALTPQQYRWLMEGLQVEQKQSIRPAEKGDFC